jgi:lambda repressor-like predicted transcriptional regulator
MPILPPIDGNFEKFVEGIDGKPLTAQQQRALQILRHNFEWSQRPGVDPSMRWVSPGSHDMKQQTFESLVRLGLAKKRVSPYSGVYRDQYTLDETEKKQMRLHELRILLVEGESVLPAVDKAREILGDKNHKRALNISKHDPYPDKRMTPAMAGWLKDGIMQSPDEHAADVVKFKELRAKFTAKDSFPNPAQRTKAKELLKFDAAKADHYADIQDWNRKAQDLLGLATDTSTEGLEVVGKHNGYTMYKVATKKNCQVPLVKNRMKWCVIGSHFGKYGGPPYYPVVNDDTREPVAMVIPAYFDTDPDQAVRDAKNKGRLSAVMLKKIRPLAQMVLPLGQFKKPYIKGVHGTGKIEDPSTLDALLKSMNDYAIEYDDIPDKWKKKLNKWIFNIEPSSLSNIIFKHGSDLFMSIPHFEDMVEKNSECSFSYARYVIKGPWPKGEDAIAKSAKYSCDYAKEVIRGPFPKGEDIIAKSGNDSYYYAKYVIKGPWPKGEDAIAKNPDSSYFYALGVIKGPFPKGEDAIATNAEYSYMYAKDVIDGPFQKGEAAIKKMRDYYEKYINFLKSLKAG